MTPSELKALEHAATKGPWAWTFEDATCMALYGPRHWENHVLWTKICKACAEHGGRCTAPSKADERLIEVGRNALPALIRLWEAAEDLVPINAELTTLAAAYGHAKDWSVTFRTASDKWHAAYSKMCAALAELREMKL